MAGTFAEVCELLANISTALGIPLAIYLFYQDRQREIREREYMTYDSLDSNYIEYLKLCLDHPDLDVFDIPLQPKPSLTPEQQRREAIVLSILCSILERSYLLYRQESTGLKIRRRLEWERYITQEWLPRDNFRLFWKQRGQGYHADFVRYMNGLVQTYEGEG